MKVEIGKYGKNDRQKASVRIHKHDLYSIDITLAHVIHPALVAHRKVMCGLNVHDEDLLLYKSEESEPAELIVDEMIFAFKEIKNEGHLSNMSDREYQGRIRNGLNLFAKYYLGLWT